VRFFLELGRVASWSLPFDWLVEKNKKHFLLAGGDASGADWGVLTGTAWDGKTGGGGRKRASVVKKNSLSIGLTRLGRRQRYGLRRRMSWMLGGFPGLGSPLGEKGEGICHREWGGKRKKFARTGKLGAGEEIFCQKKKEERLGRGGFNRGEAIDHVEVYMRQKGWRKNSRGSRRAPGLLVLGGEGKGGSFGGVVEDARFGEIGGYGWGGTGVRGRCGLSGGNEPKTGGKERGATGCLGRSRKIHWGGGGAQRGQKGGRGGGGFAGFMKGERRGQHWVGRRRWLEGGLTHCDILGSDTRKG